MRSFRNQWVAAGMAAMLPAVGNAASVDFTGTADGAYTALALPDGAALGAAGGTFYVSDPYIDSTGISGNALTSYDPDGVASPNLAPFRIDFATAVDYVSIAFDDDCFLNCDVDTGHLQAFDSGGNLLEEITYQLLEEAAPDSGLLSITASAISYVLFWSTSDVEDGENSVYWDNIAYEVSEVPLPGTLGLLGIGLTGLGLLRRKLR